MSAWDLPTRIFHWALVFSVAGGYVTRHYNPSDLTWHKWNGYAVLTLIVFRLIWGFVGGSTARFGAFVPTPLAMMRYGLEFVRGGSRRYLGHNPLGAAMVVALLLAVLAQGLTGLFNSDDILFDGPFVKLVSERAVKLAGVAHHYVWEVILVLVGLHVAANLFYSLVKREPLIQAMITGDKPAGDYVDAARAQGGSPWLALACLVVAAALVLGAVETLAGTL